MWDYRNAAYYSTSETAGNRQTTLFEKDPRFLVEQKRGSTLVLAMDVLPVIPEYERQIDVVLASDLDFYRVGDLAGGGDDGRLPQRVPSREGRLCDAVNRVHRLRRDCAQVSGKGDARRLGVTVALPLDDTDAGSAFTSK